MPFRDEVPDWGVKIEVRTLYCSEIFAVTLTRVISVMVTALVCHAKSIPASTVSTSVPRIMLQVLEEPTSASSESPKVLPQL